MCIGSPSIIILTVVTLTHFSPSQATVLDGGEGHHEVVANSGKVLLGHARRGHGLNLGMVARDLDVVERRHLKSQNDPA